MSDLKPQGTPFTLGGVEYLLYFDINAIDDIQDRFDVSIEELPDLLQNNKHVFKAVKFILSVLINEGIDEFELDLKKVDERTIGRKLNTSNIKDATFKILEAFRAGTPKGEEEVEEELPNVTSG